jgi:catechol-2,3-dioxygenase
MSQLSFDHIHYKTQSIASIRKFYIEVLEAIDLGSVDLGVEGDRKPNLMLALGGTTLLFVEGPPEDETGCEMCDDNPCTIPPWNTRNGVYHIAFLVDNCDVATAYYEQRAITAYKDDKKDIVAKAPFDASNNIRASFLLAPDGMAVELKQDLLDT